MFEKLTKKAKAAIPKVANAAKHVGKAAEKAAIGAGKATEKAVIGVGKATEKAVIGVGKATEKVVIGVGKATEKVAIGIERDAKKLVNEAVKAVPSCVKTVGAVAAKVKASIPRCMNATEQIVSQTAAKAELLGKGVKQGVKELTVNIGTRNRNICREIKEDIKQYYQDVERGTTQKGLLYNPVSSVEDVLNLLLQMRKAVVKEYPIFTAGSDLLQKVQKTVRVGIIKDGDRFGNFVYNQDIPLLSDFAGGLFHASDMKGHTPTIASSAGTVYNGIYGGVALKGLDAVVSLVSDPYGTIEGINNVLRRPEESIPAILHGIKAYADENIIHGNAEDRCRAVGEAIGQVALIAATLGVGEMVEGAQLTEGAANLGKVGEAAEIVGEAGKVGEAGEIAGEAGKAGEAGEIAGEAGKAGEAGEIAGKAAEGLDAAAEAEKFAKAKEALAGVPNHLHILLDPKKLGLGEEGMDGSESISKLYDELFKEPESAAGKSGVRISKAEKEADAVEGGGGTSGEYANEINISEQKMYQQGQHFNKHGKEMGYTSKKAYEQGARDFVKNNKSKAEIFEGTWNSSRGSQSGEVQIIIRYEGKQAIINKETGQIIDFYNGTSLDGFIDIRQVQ